MTDHTPTPWHENPECGGQSVLSARGQMIADCFSMGGPRPLTDIEAKANAAFIVRAVNSHDALVEALEAVEHLAVIHKVSKNAEATAQVLLDLVDEKIQPLLKQAGEDG